MTDKQQRQKFLLVFDFSGCGENMFMSSDKDQGQCVHVWYKKALLSLHVVWYRSNQAYCPNSKYRYFNVCHYCPLGNYQLARPYKSGPSCAECPAACDNKLCSK
ncbi:cysteine-rich venom protein TEL1-like [Menidia menidia]